MIENKFVNVASKNGNGRKAGFFEDENIGSGFSTNTLKGSVNESSYVRRRVEIFLSIEKGICDLGWKRGIDSGDVAPDSETEATMKAHARAMAEAAYRANFDPIESAHDKSRQEEFEKCRAEIIDAEQALKNEKSKLKETENNASKATAKVAVKPEFPTAIVVVAIPLITLTVAFTLYDSFVSSLGFILALTFSLLTGLCWGAFVSYLILHNYTSEENERGWANWIGLAAGVGMALGLGFIRYSQSSAEFFWLVIGLTTVEIFIVIGLEFFARQYRRSSLDYYKRAVVAGEAQSEADTVKAEIARRKDRVSELQNKIDDHIQYLDERDLRAKHKEQLIESAEKAYIDGYRGACDYNKGKNLK
jgi:hypothetical protein